MRQRKHLLSHDLQTEKFSTSKSPFGLASKAVYSDEYSKELVCVKKLKFSIQNVEMGKIVFKIHTVQKYRHILLS